MESQKEMENDTTKIDELKNKVLENLQRKVVVVLPKPHVYEQGHEPNATATKTETNSDIMAMPDLLEQKMSQQVLSALRYL
jgi:hypothetical protein